MSVKLNDFKNEIEMPYDNYEISYFFNKVTEEVEIISEEMLSLMENGEENELEEIRKKNNWESEALNYG